MLGPGHLKSAGASQCPFCIERPASHRGRRVSVCFDEAAALVVPVATIDRHEHLVHQLLLVDRRAGVNVRAE